MRARIQRCRPEGREEWKERKEIQDFFHFLLSLSLFL